MRAIPLLGLTLLALRYLGSCSREPAGADTIAGTSITQKPQTPSAALENVYVVAPRLISGSEPSGPDSFKELARKRVRTIISVAGAPPNVKVAAQHGMRYVHLPVGYDGISYERRLQAAKAIRDLPGLVYVHCHHGRHRGPMAAALAALDLGWLDRDGALAFMHRAGTSPHYRGLYEAVGGAEPLPSGLLDAIDIELPETARVSDLARAMVEIDRTFDRLMEVRNADWRTPLNHPDLVPLAEAAHLSDLFRQLRALPAVQGKSDEFARLLDSSAEKAAALEAGLTLNQTTDATRRFETLADSCSACHKAFRN